MSSTPIQILNYENREPTDAIFHTELTPMVLIDVEKEWGPIRREAAKRLYKDGRIDEVPHHWHWNWDAKSAKLSPLACKCLGIECDSKMQGLIMVLLAGKEARLDPDAGKPLVYIDYVETAPWNLFPLVEEPLYSGIGMVLMRAAVQLSYEEGFHGRIGLHSIKQSESFYRDKCGMKEWGIDPDYQNLPYYEMTREIALSFTSDSNGGEA